MEETRQAKIIDQDVTAKYVVAGKVDFDSFEIKEYKNKETKIAKYKILKSPNRFKVGEWYYSVLFETEPVGRYNEKDITATARFGVILNDKQEICWGDKSKLYTFLKSFSILDQTGGAIKQMIGAKVVTKLTEPKGENGKQFLTFEAV